MALSDFTPNLGLPYLLSNQAQKHVTLNESLRALDGLLQLSVLARDVLSPPADPGEGNRYLIGGDADGDWTGQGGKIALFADGGWLYFAPQTGWRVWIEAERLLLVFDGESWVPVTPDTLQNLTRLGLGGAADDDNPLLARLNSALFTALETANGGNGDLRYKLNKEASGNVLSLLMQTGYSSRAEIGLVGDDDLVLKVSPDGASFFEGVRIDKDDGRVSFPSGLIGVRPAITAPLALYVNAATGSDSHDGLSALTPFLTIQKAVETAAALDLSVFGVTISVADGVYADPVAFNTEFSGGIGVDLVGNISTLANCVISGPITFSVSAFIRIGGFDFAAPRALRIATKTANVEIFQPSIFSGSGNQIEQRNGGQFRISANYEIVNNFSRHLYCERHAQLIVNNLVTVTLTGTPAIAGAYAVVNDLSYVNYTPVIVGGAAGKRYDVSANGILNVNGGGATYLPGDVAGTTGTGGQYL